MTVTTKTGYEPKFGDIVTYVNSRGSVEQDGKAIRDVIFVKAFPAIKRWIIAFPKGHIHEGEGHEGNTAEQEIRGEAQILRDSFGLNPNKCFWLIDCDREQHLKLVKPYTADEKVKYMEITHKATVEKKIDLLNDRLYLSVQIDDETRKLLSQFACLKEEPVENDGFKRYRIKNVLIQQLPAFSDVKYFFAKELIDTSKASIDLSDSSFVTTKLDMHFANLVKACYELLKSEKVQISATVKKVDDKA